MIIDENIKKSRSKKYQGRPSKLTLELQGEIIALIKMGNYIDTVCSVVGLNTSTFYDWMKKGRNATNPRNKHRKFQEAVEQAQAWSIVRDVALITKASEKDWKAAAWKLERMYPDEFGLKKYEDYVTDITELDEEHVSLSKEDSAVIKEALDLIASREENNNSS
jgi:hypothetical protein